MSDQVSSLVIKSDATSVKTAAAVMDEFAQSGNAAATAATAVEKAVAQTAPAANAAAAAFNKIAPAATATQKLAGETANLGKQQKLTAYEALQLSNQIQDFFIQVSSGGSVLTAAAQQGSQLAAVFGGARGAFAALLSIITPVTVGITATAVAVGGLAYALYDGDRQSKAFRNSLLLTGNAAGLTEGKFNDLNKRIADETKSSLGAAREMAQAFVSSGQLSGSALEATTRTAVNYARATGDAAEDVQKTFASVANGVAAFAEKQNRTFNFLTAAQFRYIQQLERQGDIQKAITVTMDALNKRVDGQSRNLGTLERAWDGAKRAMSDFWEGIKGIGRDKTVDDQIAGIKAQLDALDNRKSNNPALTKQRREALQGVLQDLLAVKKVTEDQAAADAKAADQNKLQIDLTDQINAGMSRRIQYAKALADATAKADKAGLNGADRAALLKGVEDQFRPGKLEAEQAAGIQGIQRNLNVLTAAYAAAESVLETNRQAGLVGERDYYAAKQAFIRLNAEAEEKELQDENRRLAEQRKNANVIPGDARDTGLVQQIADNEARIKTIRTRAAADSKNFTTQELSAQRALAAAYVESRAAAEDYLRTLTRANQRDLAGFGQGNEERSRQSGRNQIADKYDDERARLDAQIEAAKTRNGGELTDIEAARYTEELNLLTQFKGKALAEYDDYYAKRRAQETDASLGASEAIRNYLDEQTNAARTMQQAYERTFSSLEDTLAEFYATGKLNVKSFVNTIIAEFARIEAKKATASLINSAWSAWSSYSSSSGGSGGDTGSWWSSLFSSGGRAIGGPVAAGMTYQVNERDVPEIARVGGKDYLTMGSQGGKVMPMESGMGTKVTINVGAGVQRGELVALIPELTRQIKASIQADMARPGGRS